MCLIEIFEVLIKLNEKILHYYHYKYNKHTIPQFCNSATKKYMAQKDFKKKIVSLYYYFCTSAICIYITLPEK